jgi:tetratricopeptide (TPR) repeat protein
MNQKNFKIKELIDLSSKEIQKKNFKEAKDILIEIILINPNIPKIHNNLGIINLNLGYFLEFEEILNKWIIKLNYLIKNFRFNCVPQFS